MLTIDARSPVPIYDQIKAGFKGLISKGLLKPGDPAPSVRSLAERLRVNPNTVARALRELAVEGVLESKRGAGNVVAGAAKSRAKDGLADVRAGFEEAVALARRNGLDWKDLEGVMKRLKKEAS